MKITPDYLRDTIVEIRYEGRLPFSLLKGVFFQAMSEDFKLLSNLNPLGVFQFGPRQRVEFDNSEVLDFADSEIKVQLANGSVVFNSLNEYPGWKEYFPRIKAVLNRLIETDQIAVFRRIGVRYISEFPDMAILDKVKVGLQLDFVDAAMFNTTIHSEFNVSDSRAVLNIANNVKKQSTDEDGFFSIIDIDVLVELANDADNEELFREIDRLHAIEKSIFQSLLKPSFLETLNAEYESKK